MLITTCAHCQARFRVTPQQLNARQGQVRCGQCDQVFNGFQKLERFPDDDTGARLLAEFEARRVSEAREAGPRTIDLPVDEPEPAAAASVPSAPTATRHPPERAPLPEPAPAASHPGPAPAAPPPAAASTRQPPEPELTLEMEPPPPPPRAWRFAATFLALVLGVELVYAFRGPLAERYPVLRPPMESVCARVGCAVPWSREEALLKLESSELLEVPGRAGEIALGARIRNLAPVAQEYPYLELTLTDLTGQPAVRRVLRPTDYLGRPVGQAEVLGPGVELAVQLRLETPRIKPTGYELLVFYP